MRQAWTDPMMVTLEDGTGLVHVAPGHGREDNVMGLRVGLPAYSPVDAHGRFDDTVPEWIRTKTVWEGNPIVTQHLKDSGHLVAEGRVIAPVPALLAVPQGGHLPGHRAVVRGARQADDAARASASGRWRRWAASSGSPAWSESRIRAMIETRPDWCISRQKVWDVPIPALYCKALRHRP